MNGAKAWVPDGITIAFYQRCWNMVKEDVLKYAQLS